MRHSLPIAPQFYVTAPQPCPYLEGKTERKLFTSLQGQFAQELNDSLSHQGFRRSQNILYRPTCSDCRACISARIDVKHFKASKSQKRVKAKNSMLQRSVTSPWATEEQYALFVKYLTGRHATGGMADMDIFEFAAMIEETPIKTRVIEYKHLDTDDLAAVCLSDILDDGISMVYSFYDPDLEKQSPGTAIILDHIDIAISHGLDYVYLGYWVPGSRKMEYKARFSGFEIYYEGVWQPLENPQSFELTDDPLKNDPIVEQVANIVLPSV
jgi:arginine-tRNA-protein transferase